MSIFNLKNEYDIPKFKAYVNKLFQERAVVEVKKKLPNRSLAQNSYLHLLLGFFGSEYGCSLEEAKIDFYKRTCNRDLFERKTVNKKGKEVIFAIHFEYLEKDAQYSRTLKPREIFVKNAVNKDQIAWSITGARNTYAPSDKLISLLDTYPGDIRKDASIITAVDATGNVLGVFDNKMNGTATPTDRSYDCDIILYRLAEMYMFKAEAYAALNQIPEAVIELNRVRDRAKIGQYSGAMDKLSVEKEILDERGREFYLERKRWPDLLRFHYEGVIDVYDVVPNLKNKKDQGTIIPLYCAIPLSDLDRNHNLTQTEGYENL